jgi:N-acetylglucosamine-6-phosphate deacetylase
MHLPLNDAARMASETPAEILSASGKGRIRPGADADLVVLGTEHTVEEAIVAGETVYHGGGSHVR